MTAPDALRDVPSVHAVLAALASAADEFPRALVLREIRAELENTRERVRAGTEQPAPHPSRVAELVMARLARYREPSLRRVINATGVVLHTNLGRAPLADSSSVAGYSNLEYDVNTGKRGRRDSHLKLLFDALFDKPAIAVNNGAAALFLALHELAAGYEVIVSRGELIEIGDGFRIPDIITRSGAILREVGTTNRTRVEDYGEAITDRTRVLLRVHPSNFQISGFTEKPTVEQLVRLGKQRGIPVYEDLGSGNVVNLQAFGISEPLVGESLRAGVNLVSFSGDKLLGGPQAGVLTGDAPLIDRLRRNPLYRALRLDKLIHHALEDTLRKLVLEDWDNLPALRMIRMSAGTIEERARRLFPKAELIPGESVVGGGSTPAQSIPTMLIVAARNNVALSERALRAHNLPVIARVSDDLLLLDLRTVFPEEEEALRDAVSAL